jgi:hypothetical protein
VTNKTENATLSKIIKFPLGTQEHTNTTEKTTRNLNNSEIAHDLQLKAHNANKNMDKMWEEHSYQNEVGINMTDRLIDYINGGKQRPLPLNDEIMEKYKK